ncbi:MAG: ABC transporter ATP-binding protein [Pirellulales bacterium]
MRRGFRQSGVAWAEMTSVLADTIPGIRVVKAFAQEAREISRFDAANQRVLDTNDRVNYVWAFFSPLVRLLTEAGMLIVWGFGAWLILRTSGLEMSNPEKFTVGALTACIEYIRRFYGKTEEIIRMLAAVQRAAASAHRIFEILDRTPSVPEPAKPVPAGRLHGRIELRDVRFKYGTRKVLHGLNLAIEPGEMIGLVGPSGAGKSTLVNMICRFYDVSEGAILADGVDTRSFPVSDYRRNIGIVLQDPFLFYGTIAENISYGKPDATRAEIIKAARSANGARVYSAVRRWIRLAGRRTGAIALRRRTPTDFDRTGIVDRSADSDSRRSDVRGRHRDRTRDSIRARQADRRTDDDRDRAPIEYVAPCEPLGCAREGKHRRDRHAPRIAGTARCLLRVAQGAARYGPRIGRLIRLVRSHGNRRSITDFRGNQAVSHSD